METKKFYYTVALALCTGSVNAMALQENKQDTTSLGGIHQLEQVVITGNGHHELKKNSTTPVHVMTATYRKKWNYRLSECSDKDAAKCSVCAIIDGKLYPIKWFRK